MDNDEDQYNKNSTPPKIGIGPRTYCDLIHEKVLALDKRERNYMMSETYFGQAGLAGISAFLINTYLKRSMMLYEGVVVTNVICIVSTFGLNILSRKIAVDLPLYQGKLLSCPVCAPFREGTLQAVTSTFVPLVASISISALFAERYEAAKVPSLTWKNRSEAWKFWAPKISTLRTPFYFFFIVQGLFGAYIGYRKREIMAKVHDSVTEEEVDKIIQLKLQEYRHYLK